MKIKKKGLFSMFKTIPDYPKYQINEVGEVYSLYSKKILKPNLRNGYYSVMLSNNGERHRVDIHRLVAICFVPNDDPENKTFVNHKDEDKLNNNADNLEWCTQDYNNSYGTRVERAARANGYPVEQIDDQGNVIATYESQNSAARAIGCTSSQLSAAVRLNRKCHGYYFRKVQK